MDNANVGIYLRIVAEYCQIGGAPFFLDGKTVSQYLEEANFNPQTIAVELNEDILPKPQYGETVLKDGDVLEVVSFVGGG